MPRTIAFDWEADYLAGVEADVSGGTVHVRRCFRYDWPEMTEPPPSAAVLGDWLAESLKRDGISAGDARVVLPREAVVVRKLDLPKVPENELAELVRFQAATKSSMPLDRLALDFLTLPVDDGDTAQQVLMVTVEGERLKRIQATLTAAGIELRSVGISPVTVGELVTHRDGEQPNAPHQATLVIFQDARRVELTTLVERRVIFSHHSRLSGDAAGLRTSTAEINRTVIALSQAQSDLEIADVCLIHPGDTDPAFEQSLTDRFGDRLQVLDVAQMGGIKLARSADAAGLASYAPALGALLAAGESRVAAIDFLDPRKAFVAPDRTKQRIAIGAIAAVTVLGVGYWIMSSRLANLVSETQVVTDRVTELDSELKQGEPELEAAAILGEWVGASHDPLAVLDRLNRLAPGTDRVYLEELTMDTEGRDGTYNVKGVGAAIEQDDVEQLQEVLERAGMRVEPTVPGRSSDPDYPRGVNLQVELPRSDQTEPAATSQPVSLK